MGRLNAAMVRGLTKPGRYGDGGTLFLNVAPGGSKSWIQRLAIDGKRHDIGLGGFPLVTLAEAREAAFENRRLARCGGDPLAAKRRAKAPTFREAAERTFEANRARWRNNKTTANWLQGMVKRVLPVLGDMRVDAIGREDVLRILTPIWTSRPEIARKLRSRIRAVLAWAQAHGHVEHNVAGEAIDGTLPAMPAVKAHFRALPHAEVAVALDVIATSRASVSARACLRFVVLTACRSGEARLATWNEIDMEARTWRVPASRMKGGAEHRVALSEAALAVLESVRPLRDRSDLAFPVADAAGEDAERHDVDEGAPGHRVGGPGDRSRLPLVVPRLVRRHREATRDRRGGLGAHGRRCRRRLLPFGPIRAAPPADGPVGAVRDRRRREGGAVQWLISRSMRP